MKLIVTGTYARVDDVMISALSKSLHLGIGVISTQATTAVSLFIESTNLIDRLR